MQLHIIYVDQQSYEILIEKAKDSMKNLIFPNEFHGIKLSLWDHYPTIDEKII